MPRIAGVDIPGNKQTVVALGYIFGIGPTLSGKILDALGIDRIKRSKDLTNEEVSRISAYIDKNYMVEGQLRRQEGQNIQRLKRIACYRGSRHTRGLPVRGQRTRTNARTRKGRRKTVAVKKKLIKK